ncbi:ABC transporter permease [Microbulbifer aggregans]|uniref:ABC transporter permease n=1 Tax=Microbulbifer aggregans TaxID=1769779 RepID=UPI001CFD9F24|nr:ABC transporter permease [Microbulbifer aggregans]
MFKNYLSIIWIRGIGALKADAENSYLGSLWWVLEPILLTALFYVAFATGLKGGGKGSDFVYFLICALIPFKWTSSSITGSSSSITSNKGILGQFYLPKWIFPTAVNFSMLLRFLFVLPILCIFVAMGGYEPQVVWFFVLPILICQLFINLGFSYLTAAMVPLIPDLKHLVSLGMTAILFTSGIFFDINSRPESVQELLRLNPFVTIFDSYRAVLLRGEFLELHTLLYPCLFAVFAYTIGAITLRRFDRYYPRTLL